MDVEGKMNINYEWRRMYNCISMTHIHRSLWENDLSMIESTHPPKQILYKSSNLIKNINAQCLRVSILLYSQEGIVLICLWRVQGCSGRGETPARCSCSGCFGFSRVIAASSVPLSSSKTVWIHQHAAAGHGRGVVKLWHVYCRSCQCR